MVAIRKIHKGQRRGCRRPSQVNALSAQAWLLGAGLPLSCECPSFLGAAGWLGGQQQWDTKVKGQAGGGGVG